MLRVLMVCVLVCGIWACTSSSGQQERPVQEALPDVGGEEPAVDVPVMEERRGEGVLEQQEEGSLEASADGGGGDAVRDGGPEGGVDESVERVVEGEGDAGASDSSAPEAFSCPVRDESGFPNVFHLEGCKGLKQGPYKDKDAGKDRASAPEILVDHNGYRLRLLAGQVGLFKFDAWRRCNHYFFFDQAVKVQVEDLQGNPVAISREETSVRECKDIKQKTTVRLAKVEYYYFKLGPFAEETTVTVLVSDGHAHN